MLTYLSLAHPLVEHRHRSMLIEPIQIAPVVVVVVVVIVVVVVVVSNQGIERNRGGRK